MSTQSAWWLETSIVNGLYERLITDTYYRLVAAMIFVWGFMDTASTHIAVQAYGTVDYELNPITRDLMHIDPYLLIAVKGIALLAVGLIAVRGREHIEATPGWRFIFDGLVWAGIAVTTLNLYAAYVASTGHDPVFNFIGFL